MSAERIQIEQTIFKKYKEDARRVIVCNRKFNKLIAILTFWQTNSKFRNYGQLSALNLPLICLQTASSFGIL